MKKSEKVRLIKIWIAKISNCTKIHVLSCVNSKNQQSDGKSCRKNRSSYSIIYKKTYESHYEWLRVTTNDYEWLRVTTSYHEWLRVRLRMTTSEYEWLRVTTNDYEWLRMTTNDYEWLRMTTNDYEWLRMTTNDYRVSR